VATEHEHDEDELLTAYLDGVGELSPDERRRVEQRLANDPALRRDADEIRSLLDDVRKLPSGATEPDWSALERQIRESVGPSVPLPWWRRVRWVAPIGTLVTTAAIALLWLHHAPTEPAAIYTHDSGVVSLVAPPVVAAAEPAQPPPTTTMYIDGQVIDISNVDPEALMDDDAGDNTAAATDNAVLPAADYNWIDGLDDKAMERAERWLARKKG
jgi:hypothetical protein